MSLWGYHTHIIEAVFFSPVNNMSCVNLISRPARDPRREEGKTFFLPNRNVDVVARAPSWVMTLRATCRNTGRSHRESECQRSLESFFADLVGCLAHPWNYENLDLHIWWEIKLLKAIVFWIFCYSQLKLILTNTLKWFHFKVTVLFKKLLF